MNYDNILANVVVPKIKEFGKTVTLRQKSITLGDWVKTFDNVEMIYIWTNSTTGEVLFEEPSVSTVSHEINMIVDTFKKREIDGEFVKAGDIKTYMSPDVHPNSGDTILLEGKEYVVYHVETVKPANVTLLYTLYVRNANG